jgi:Zn-dependent protease with chaperone function
MHKTIKAGLVLVFALTALSLHAENPAYSLPPDKLAKAIALNHAEILLDGARLIWGFVSLLLILQLGVASWLNRFSARFTPKPWLQGFIFLPLLLLLTSLLEVPLSIIGHHISLAYGLSIQHWLSWLGDGLKSLALTLVVGTLVLSILFAIVRHAPRFWWFWFWLISIPLIVASFYLVPIFIDPLFNHFEPLQQTDPALVAQLERVVQKAGVTIPPSRMFLMKASEKVTTSNAYVTGFGASKRVVVWDTTIHSSTPDGVLFIFGHELGHYVLGHVLIGVFGAIFGTLIFLWLTYHLAHWLLRKYGESWQVASLSSWGAVVILLLASQVLSFFSEPIQNTIGRSIEHQADVYGEEVIHGIVADPQHTAQQSFQELGEDSLDIPNPNPLIVFWSYTHPTILERATFALHYNPWASGQQPKYVR